MNKQSKDKKYFFPNELYDTLKTIIEKYNGNRDNIGYGIALNILKDKHVTGHQIKKIIFLYKKNKSFLNVFGNSDIRSWFFNIYDEISRIEQSEIESRKKLGLKIRKSNINEKKDYIIFILKNEK